MPPVKKEDLGAPKKPLSPERQAYKDARQVKWASVHAALEAGDADQARSLIAELQQEAKARFIADNGEG